MWSKVKAILRKMRAQTIDDLIAAVGVALGCVSCADLRGWLKHANYL